MRFNARFNLRKQSSKKPQKIYLICRLWGEKYVYPTPFNVLPKHWNTKEGLIRNVIAEPERDFINDYLKELRAKAKRLYDLNTSQRNTLSKNDFRKYLDIWAGKIQPDKPTFWGWTEKYISDSPNRINPRTGRNISRRTIQEYNTTFKYLAEFEKTLSKDEKLNFDSIELNTLNDFRDYLTTEKKFSVNNIAKHIDNFRQFLRAAQDEKISIDPDLTNPKRFRIAREEAVNIYLNEKELSAIYGLDFSESERLHTLTQSREAGSPQHVKYATLDKVRDLFLIGCFTGMRVSDYTNLKPFNINGDYQYINYFQKKTGNEVVIPISIFPTLRPILMKYEGQPPKLSQPKINLYIKEIAKLAGIADKVEKQPTKGGVKNSIVFEKWQLVTSHTARRSFASNLLKKGVPENLVRAMTGHKKEGVFRKYNKLNAMEKAAAVVNLITKK